MSGSCSLSFSAASATLSLSILRACIGQRFARLELFTLMVKLVQTYTMEYVGDGEVGVHTRLVSVPDRKIKIKFTER